MKRHGKIAVLAGAMALVLAPASSFAGGDKPPTPPKDHCKKHSKSKCPKVKQGRMTGHGHFISPTYGKVQWEFRNSVCNANRFPDLKVEWGTNRFRLTSYTEPLTCLDTPFDEGNPRAGFDTITAQGTGTLNGAPASITFRFTDAGEPGRDDRATFTIVQGGAPVIEVSDQRAAAGGNHQAHRR